MIKEKGSINDTSVIRLLLTVFEEDITGTLHLKRESIQKTLYFKRGKLEYAKSNSDLDKLENILVSEKLIDKTKLNAVKSKIEKSESLGKALVEEGLIPLEKLISTIKRQLKMIILGVLKWKEGSYQHISETPPDNGINLDLNIIDFIINHILTNLQESYILDEMKSRTSPFKRNPNNIKISKFNLSDKQKELLNSFSTEKKIDDVLSKFPDVHRASLSKIIYFFIISNLLQPTEVELQDDTSDEELSIADELIDNQLVKEPSIEDSLIEESVEPDVPEEETSALDLPIDEDSADEPPAEQPAQEQLSVNLSPEIPVSEEPPSESLPQEPVPAESFLENLPPEEPSFIETPPGPVPQPEDSLPEEPLVESNQITDPPVSVPDQPKPPVEEDLPVNPQINELPPEPPRVEDHSAADLPPIIMGRMGKVSDLPPEADTDYKTLESELEGATLESAFVLDHGGEEIFREKVSTTKFLKGGKQPAGEKKKSKLFNYILISIMLIFLIGGSIVIFILPEEKIEEPVTRTNQQVTRPRTRREILQNKTEEDKPTITEEQTPAATEEKDPQADNTVTPDNTKNAAQDDTQESTQEEKTDPQTDPEPVRETPTVQTEEPKPAITEEIPVPSKSAFDFFMENNYRSATRLWRQELEANRIQFSILLEMDCLKESVQNAFSQVQAKDKFLIIERNHNGKTCYLVLWGKYTSRKDAEDELPTVSQYFWQQTNPPRVVDLAIYL